MKPTPNIFSAGLITTAVAVLLAVAVPLGFHYSQLNAETRLRRGFTTASAVLIGLLSGYLLAALDQKALHQRNVWFPLVLAIVLLPVLAVLALQRLEVPSGAPSVTEALRSPEVYVCTSSEDYARRILEIEAGAERIDRLVKRVSAVFKDPLAVQAIAVERFGPGSPQAEAYVTEHRERHRLFIERLQQRDLRCREIYNRSELLGYAATRRHGVDIVLGADTLRRTMTEWLSCVDEFDNYFVGITTDPIPLKYQLTDSKVATIHEATGSLDGQRVNAIYVETPAAVLALQRDFDNIWERIPPKERSKASVRAFIEEELLPLLGPEQTRQASRRRRP